MTSLATPSPVEAALRQALERQVADLIAVAAGLGWTADYPPIAPTDWHGPASEAYASLEARLRAGVDVAARAVETALQSSRLALAELGG
jgi:hypothetical protein